MAAPFNASPANLVSMPAEMLLQITSFLTTPELGNVRLTCKTVEAALLASFAREFFTKRQFIFTKFSLQALVDISKSRFSTTLKHLIFDIKLLDLINVKSRRGDVTTAHDRARANLRMKREVEHMAFLNTGEDLELLSEAFSNLKNLEIVGMRDFNSRSRMRDWPHVEWKSYGIPTLTRTYVDPGRGALRHNTSSFGYMKIDTSHTCRVFLNILRGLGKSRVQVNDFQVILRHAFLPDYAFYRPDHIKPVIAAVLANLKTLFLDLDSNPALYLDEDNNDCMSYYLRQFLADVSNLEHLRLNNFRWHNNSHRLNEFLAWLSKSGGSALNHTTSSQSLLECPPSVDLPMLRQLDIGMARISAGSLFGLLKKFRLTLHIISFHQVTLVDHDEGKIADRVNIWSKVFLHMADIKLHLTSMNLSLLSQELTRTKGSQHLSFKDGSTNKSFWKWNGVDIQSGLRDLQPAMVVDWKAFEVKEDDGYGSVDDSDDVSMDDISDMNSDENHDTEDHDDSEDDSEDD